MLKLWQAKHSYAFGHKTLEPILGLSCLPGWTTGKPCVMGVELGAPVSLSLPDSTASWRHRDADIPELGTLIFDLCWN